MKINKKSEAKDVPKKFNKIRSIKTGFHITAWFSNDRFVMVFSILAAVILWVTVAMSDTDTDSHQMIDGITIDIPLSQAAQDDGLRVFETLPDAKASLSITGNRRVISQVTSKDIQVIAQQAGEITAPGTYPLLLTAKQNGLLTNYSISQTSLYPQSITVTVDRYREKEFTIEDNMQYKIDGNYFHSSTDFNPAKVTISGPESVISKITKVEAAFDISDMLSATKTATVPLKLYDSFGDEITGASLQRITMSTKQTEANIIVMKKAVLPVIAAFTNAPSGWGTSNSRVTVKPNTLEIAGLENILNTFKEVKLNSLDFSKISLTNNKVELPVELPTGCKNLSNTSTAVVTVNTDGMISKSLTMNQFTFANVPTGKKAAPVTNSLSVEVVGPAAQVDALTGDSIMAKIDLKNNSSFTGHTDMPLTFSIQGAPDCWVYGTYQATISVTDATASAP